MTTIAPARVSAGFARDANALLAGADARDVIAWAAETFGDRLVVTSAMADGLLAHLAAEVVPGIEVLFLDTGYHFAETLRTRSAVEAASDVRVRTVLPLLDVPAQDAAFGPRLHDRDPDACCRMRKVEPLDRALEPYLAWMSGVRRDQSAGRADTPLVGWDARRHKIALHPVAAWTTDEVDDYLARRGIVVNPLQAQGFASIGCAPCTRAVRPGEDPRDARWSGLGKTECGIHL